MWADREKTRQVLLNVLTNAYKYSPNGGAIELHAWLDSGNPHQTWVCVRVTDRGIGMTPEQASHLYERFWRADTSGHIPGTGLGMSLVKEVMQLQGGEVEVHTEWQVGTQVTLRWPQAQGRQH
jgi:signal transduction histidine kinase